MAIPAKTYKILINSVDDTVDESLSGLCRNYPQLEYIASHRIVISPDLEARKDKVCIICGGGSGHEPFAAGFVGSGMLTASIAGSVFAAPPSMHIAYALERVSAYTKAGILVVIPNYTGDCLNFGIAVEKKRQAGMIISDIIIGEDCSIPVEEQGIAGTRGLSGIIFIIKIAGALAERGLPLKKISTVAQIVLEHMATYAVGLTACVLPGQSAIFELADDEIELGMGVHGEAGYERIQLGTAREVVALMLKRICNSISLINGDSVAVLLNNFGGLSQLEQGIVCNEIVMQLENMNINPVRVYSGLFMTSLNSAGVHITLLKLPEIHKNMIVSCLDDPTTAPQWPGCVYSIPLNVPRKSTTLVPTKRVDKIGIEIEKPNQELFKQCLKNASEAIIENEAYLNNLDRGCGDGDCGTTLKRLAHGILEKLNDFYLSHPSSVMSELANIAEERMGGTSGALYTLFLTTLAKELSTLASNEWQFRTCARIFRSGLNSLQKYGKAKRGDRTMLDALSPACETCEKNTNLPLANIYEEVAHAAWQGCEATKNMKPRKSDDTIEILRPGGLFALLLDLHAFYCNNSAYLLIEIARNSPSIALLALVYHYPKVSSAAV